MNQKGKEGKGEEGEEEGKGEEVEGGEGKEEGEGKGGESGAGEKGEPPRKGGSLTQRRFGRRKNRVESEIGGKALSFRAAEMKDKRLSGMGMFLFLFLSSSIF